jgi:GNAT superfamily N-acetyltransferase
MDRLRYRRFAGKMRELTELVDCYRRVFATPPWNEWKLCSACETKWGSEQRDELEAIGFVHCDQPVQDFWPVDVVSADVRREVSREASCWVAWHGRSIVGFCWGYPITPSALAEKLGLSDLATVIKTEFGEHEVVAYQDELGVDQRYRGRGIAHALFDLRLQDFRKAGLHVGVVRTMTNPPTVTYQWFTRIGYHTIASYNDADGKVVLARVLGGIAPQPVVRWWQRLKGLGQQ